MGTDTSKSEDLKRVRRGKRRAFSFRVDLERLRFRESPSVQMCGSCRAPELHVRTSPQRPRLGRNLDHIWAQWEDVLLSLTPTIDSPGERRLGRDLGEELGSRAPHGMHLPAILSPSIFSPGPGPVSGAPGSCVYQQLVLGKFCVMDFHF